MAQAQSNSTAPIKALFREVLDSLPRPLTEDVTDDVFYAIEKTPAWMRRYEHLCELRTKKIVNTWGGYWVGNAVQRIGLSQVAAQKSKLILSYSKLDRPAPPKAFKKITENSAREQVFSYYKVNSATLPPKVRELREEIVALVINGMSPTDAFAVTLNLSAPLEY